MKKLLNITCAIATLLVSKKEDGKLSFLEKIQLRLHLSICSFCRLFAKQSFLIGNNAKHAHTTACLTNEQKEKIKELIKAS
ncbi:MAG: zf-HC2 domain-containing protein [Chitinophagaceae bacterium]|nr:zf-HC2 domain-containing protein [Chitinophagaceae bacterium]